MSSKLNNGIEDDLEYHINFPIPELFENKLDVSDTDSKVQDTNSSSKYKIDDGKEQNFKCRNHGVNYEIHRPKTEPVVFLLGWLNAQDRHLAKYSSLYNKLGCITVRYIAPSRDLFSFTQVNLKLIAKKLIKLMEDTTLSHHPVIFHNFSNHGSTLYTHISQLMESSSENQLEVVGCIFDSTPAPRCITSALKAVYRTTRGSLFYRVFITTLLGIALSSWKALSILSTLLTGSLPSSPPWCLLQESFMWPQLFLYSKIDDLISYQDVELFAAERQQRGVQVFMHEFIDSPHVMHYKVHPEEYRNVVKDFIEFCLKNRSNNSSAHPPEGVPS